MRRLKINGEKAKKLFGVDLELEVSVTKRSLDTHVCVHTLLYMYTCTYTDTCKHIHIYVFLSTEKP